MNVFTSLRWKDKCIFSLCTMYLQKYSTKLWWPKKTLAIKQFCIPLYLCFCCQFRNNWPSAGISTRLHFYSDNIWNNNFQFCLIVTHSLSFMFSSMTNKWHVTGSSISKYIFSFKWHMDLVFCQAWT